jgi:hypothetical protein
MSFEDNFLNAILEWENIFANHSFYRELISRIPKELKKLNNKT